jgi:hypothetical protein
MESLDDDLRQSIARIKASPFVPRADRIRVFVYSVDEGSLREVMPSPTRPSQCHSGFVTSA